MNSINENLWNEVEFNEDISLNNDECWNHTNNCIDWCKDWGCACNRDFTISFCGSK